MKEWDVVWRTESDAASTSVHDPYLMYVAPHLVFCSELAASGADWTRLRLGLTGGVFGASSVPTVRYLLWSSPSYHF